MKNNKVLIIAEVGINHNGNLKTALKLIEKAKKAGADIVKFQTFNSSKIASDKAELVDYQKDNIHKKNQKEMLQALELSDNDIEQIIFKCNDVGIEYLTTAFDDESLSKISKQSLKRYKIPSGEITNLPYLRKIASFGKPIIMSTGMSDLKEVLWALDKLIEGGSSKENITILHCTSEYPCPLESVNLRAMKTLYNNFKTDIGYSDHTLGIEVAIAAVGMGAKIIEKHITLDKNMIGPDHKASIEPYEFKKMVESIRIIEKSLGDGVKQPSEKELTIRKNVRKFILAAKEIKKGEMFSETNITTKRTNGGVSAMYWDNYIGKKATNNYLKDEEIKE